MRQTSVLRLDIVEASAKARTHGVADDDEDLALPVWAGLVPSPRSQGDPSPIPNSDPTVELAPSVRRLVAR
jgi:uncharacterized protein